MSNLISWMKFPCCKQDKFFLSTNSLLPLKLLIKLSSKLLFS